MRIALLVALAFLLCVPQKTHAQWITLNKPGAIDTFAKGIDGTNIVGSYNDNHGQHAFLYDGLNWTTLIGGDQANDIDGKNIVGQFHNHGFLFDGTSYHYLDYPGANVTAATSIDGKNILGIYYVNGQPSHSFLYDGTTWTSLYDPLAEEGTYATGIDGKNIVGTYTEGPAFTEHGFIYDGTTWTTLDAPGGFGTDALGINGKNILGFYFDSSHIYHGYLFDGATWTHLDAPLGANGTKPSGMSDNNIVGFYEDSSNHFHGFETEAVPEGGSIGLLIAGLLLPGIGFVRRQKQTRHS